MANLLALANSNTARGGMTTNINVNGGGLGMTPSAAFTSTPALGQTNMDPVPQDHWSVEALKYMGAAPVDVVDTVASLVPGIKRGATNDAFYRGIGLPGAADWVRENQGGVEVASGILGAVATSWLAEAATAKLLSNAWFATTGAGRVASALDMAVSRASQLATQESLAAAQSGKALGWFAKGANRNYVGLATLQGVAKAGVSELAVVAVLHNNTAIWSDDMSTNMIFSGIGLALGALPAGIAARGKLMKDANSIASREAFANARDPAKFLKAFSEMPTGVQIAGAGTNYVPRTADFTAVATDWRRVDTDIELSVPDRKAMKREAEATTIQVLQTITNRGADAVPASSFSVKGAGESRHILAAAHEDPTILLGAASIGKVDADMGLDAQLAGRAGKIKDMKLPLTTAAEKRRAARLEKQTAMILLDKQWVELGDARPFIDYEPVTKFQTTAKGTNQMTWEAPVSGRRMTLSEDGSINGNWLGLTREEQLSVLDAMREATPRMMNPKLTHKVPANATFMQLDWFVDLAKKGANVDFKSLANLADAEEAMVASLKLKAAAALRMPNLGFNERFRLNLPRATEMERLLDPTGMNMKQLLAASNKQGVRISDLTKLREQLIPITDLTTDLKVKDNITGDIFEFNRIDAEGGREWGKPVLGFFDPQPPASYSRAGVAQQVAEGKAATFRFQMSRKSAPMTAELTGGIISSGDDYVKTADILGLADNQVPGTGNVASTVGSQFATKGMRARHNVTLQGAQRIRSFVDRVVQRHVDGALKRLSTYTDALTSASGKQSKMLFDAYHTYANGWDIRAAKAMPDGTIQFQLEPKSANNAARLGRAVRQDEFLMNPMTNQPVVLDKLANDTRVALEMERKALLAEQNTVIEARGGTPIKHKKFSVSSPSTRNARVAFTVDAAGQLVPGKGVVAKTDVEFESMTARARANLAKGETLVTKDDIKRYADIWESLEMGFVNPLEFVDPTSMARPGGAQTGKLASMTVNARAYEDALMYIKRGYEQIGNGVIRNTFDGQLKLARMSKAAQETSGLRPGETKGVFDLYEETLLGKPVTANPVGITKAAVAIDRLVDKAFETMWPAAAVSVNHLRDLVAKVTDMGKPMKGLAAIKTFEDATDVLGPHMPFADVTAFAEYKYGLKAPWTGKDVARFSNRIGAAVVLRWLEVPNALMNLSGMITAMPGIMGSTNLPLIGKVKGQGVVDTMKIMAKGMKRVWGQGSAHPGTMSADTKYMVKHGYMTQEVAEFHKQMNTLKGRSSFGRFMTGDERFADWRNYTGRERAIREAKFRGVEGWASWITDTTESWSRMYSHYIGLELADLHGITGMEARHNFARQIADEAIANYDPLNRPEIFQSAFGSMYGLFLSYAQNYYERLFRWVEGGDKVAIKRSLVTQASLFGVNGMPGGHQLVDWLGSDDDGDGLVANIYKRLGPGVGSVVANGSFDQITSLLTFGVAPAVSLHTRGDANFRHPGLDVVAGKSGLPIGLEVLKDVVDGTFGMVGALGLNPLDQNTPKSAQYAAEVMARTMPNRMLRGTISVLFAGGKESDAYGQLVTDNQNVFETVYRMLGVRSARQQDEIESYYLSQKSLGQDAAAMDKVRSASRGLIRAGNFDQLPKVFDDYVAAGGKPWNYSNWIRGLIKDAQQTRTQLQLHKMMKQRGMQDLSRRIDMMTRDY